MRNTIPVPSPFHINQGVTTYTGIDNVQIQLRVSRQQRVTDEVNVAPTQWRISPLIPVRIRDTVANEDDPVVLT